MTDPADSGASSEKDAREGTNQGLTPAEILDTLEKDYQSYALPEVYRTLLWMDGPATPQEVYEESTDRVSLQSTANVLTRLKDLGYVEKVDERRFRAVDQ